MCIDPMSVRSIPLRVRLLFVSHFYRAVLSDVARTKSRHVLTLEQKPQGFYTGGGTGGRRHV
jgi:hypothetical protein